MNPSIAIKVIAGGVCAIFALASPLAEVCAADLDSADEVRAATYDNMDTNRTFDITATVALPHIRTYSFPCARRMISASSRARPGGPWGGFSPSLARFSPRFLA